MGKLMPYTSLNIKCVEESKIGHCWTGCKFLVTSRVQLDKPILYKLFNMGFIGSGQEFWVTSPCDGTEKRNEECSFEYTCIVRCDSSG